MCESLFDERPKRGAEFFSIISGNPPRPRGRCLEDSSLTRRVTMRKPLAQTLSITLNHKESFHV